MVSCDETDLRRFFRWCLGFIDGLQQNDPVVTLQIGMLAALRTGREEERRGEERRSWPADADYFSLW